MSGVLARTIRTLAEVLPGTRLPTEPSVTGAIGASATTTVVLAVLGLLVTSSLVVIGWKIVDRYRAVDVDNNDLKELIALLRALDVEVRRLTALPRPADSADLHEIERLVPYAESHSAQSGGRLQSLMGDVVETMKECVKQPVDGNVPIGMLATLIRQQARTADRLQAVVAQALAEARQLRG